MHNASSRSIHCLTDKEFKGNSSISEPIPAMIPIKTNMSVTSNHLLLEEYFRGSCERTIIILDCTFNVRTKPDTLNE